MRNILITVAYDGTNFHGYQDQGPKKLRTVETLLRSALEKTVLHPVALQSAGRTDKGVHALGQKANFLSDTTIDLGNFPRVVNYHLPRDLSITEAVEVPEDFHARYGAKRKHYKYRIYNAKHRSGMLDRYAVHAPFPLDVERMERALKKIEGFHDYSAFILSLIHI